VLVHAVERGDHRITGWRGPGRGDGVDTELGRRPSHDGEEVEGLAGTARLVELRHRLHRLRAALDNVVREADESTVGGVARQLGELWAVGLRAVIRRLRLPTDLLDRLGQLRDAVDLEDGDERVVTGVLHLAGDADVVRLGHRHLDDGFSGEPGRGDVALGAGDARGGI